MWTQMMHSNAAKTHNSLRARHSRYIEYLQQVIIGRCEEKKDSPGPDKAIASSTFKAAIVVMHTVSYV